MNESPTAHLDDEALSAALDDDMEPVAEAHLAACAVCSRRRDQLAVARSAIATATVEPLDELTRHRLMSRALTEAGAKPTSQRWSHRTVLVGSIAAALIAALAAVPLLADLGGNGGGDEATSLAALPAGQFVGDLGDVSDPAVVRARLLGTEEAAGAAAEAPAAAAPPAAPKAAAPTPTADATRTAPAPADPEAFADDAQRLESGEHRQDLNSPSGDDRAVADKCVERLVDGPAKNARLVAVGLGTYRGTPVVVAAFTKGEQTTAYVAARDGCRVLDRYEL